MALQTLLNTLAFGLVPFNNSDAIQVFSGLHMFLSSAPLCSDDFVICIASELPFDKSEVMIFGLEPKFWLLDLTTYLHCTFPMF